MEKLFQLLNGIYPLSEGLTDYLLQTLKIKELSKKDYLLRAGHVCRHVCFVEKGLIRCFYFKGDNEVAHGL